MDIHTSTRTFQLVNIERQLNGIAACGLSQCCIGFVFIFEIVGVKLLAGIIIDASVSCHL